MSKVYLKVPPEEHGALCKPSPLRDRPMCVHARKAQGQATEPSKVPTAGKSSFVVAPMGSCYVVLYMYWLSRQFQEDNSTSADDTSVLSLASLVFSVVGPFAVARYTLTSGVLSSPFFGEEKLGDGFFMFVADSTDSLE